MRCRVAVGLLVAAAFVAFAAPTTFLARRAGARGGFAPMALHRWLLSMLRVRVRRFGVPAPGPRLLVVNHVSWLDILILGAAEPMAFLAKSEVGAVVWTRWLVDLQGAVYVDRQRKRCIPAVNAEIARRIAAGGCVALFAEGTTSDGTRLLPFRSSHFEPARTGVVQPVYLHYRATGGLAATRGDKLVAAWYGDMTFLASLKRVLASGGVCCDLHYGEPFAADGRDRKALARAAEAAMRRLKAEAHAGSPSRGLREANARPGALRAE